MAMLEDKCHRLSDRHRPPDLLDYHLRHLASLERVGAFQRIELLSEGEEGEAEAAQVGEGDRRTWMLE